MIKVDGVTKRLGNFIIDDISFDIPKGYICGMAGRNGAGKTSIFNLLTGIYTPERGEIYIDGMPLTENESKIHEMTGFVFTEELFEKYSSLDQNAKMYCRYFEDFDYGLFVRYLKEFELEEKQKYGKLSKGQKIKFEFAFAIAHNPKVLFLDEPSANFDPKFRIKFFEILRNFIRDGEKTVLISSHQTDDLDVIADYLIFVDKGKIVYDGDIESFRDKYIIVTAENYKIRNLPKDKMISSEEGKYSSKALVYDSKSFYDDSSLTVTVPSIEEFMYFYSKKSEN